MVLKICLVCGNEFTPYGSAKTCSLDCRKSRLREKQHIYNQSPGSIRRRLEYSQRSETKKRKREYGKNYQREYSQRPYVKERERKRAQLRNHARRAAKANLAYPVTNEQWEYALNYFYGCCAVCECQLDGMFGETKTNQDHWIPHNAGGDYSASNIVPLCRTCNRTKSAIIPIIWLERKFGKCKAKKIIDRIETYFEHIKDR